MPHQHLPLPSTTGRSKYILPAKCFSFQPTCPLTWAECWQPWSLVFAACQWWRRQWRQRNISCQLQSQLFWSSGRSYLAHRLQFKYIWEERFDWSMTCVSIQGRRWFSNRVSPSSLALPLSCPHCWPSFWTFCLWGRQRKLCQYQTTSILVCCFLLCFLQMCLFFYGSYWGTNVHLPWYSWFSVTKASRQNFPLFLFHQFNRQEVSRSSI